MRTFYELCREAISLADELLLPALVAALLVLLGSGAAAALEPPRSAEAAGEPARDTVIENGVLRVEVDARSGAIVSVFNKRSGIELIEDRTTAGQLPPWELFLDSGDTPVRSFEEFALSRADDEAEQRIVLRWRLASGVVVTAAIALPYGDGPLSAQASVANPTDQSIASLSFPVIRGIGALAGSGADDYLAHPVVTGMLFRNPKLLFSYGTAGGVRRARYPSGEGSPMQFMAYYAKDAGGFYLAAHDPYLSMKEIDFYYESALAGLRPGLVASFRHWNWDIRPNSDFALDYPVVISPLVRGDWYEAADLYREWAERQDWVRRGKLIERADDATARWLVEEVGLSTFGAKGDRWNPRFFEQLARDLDTPIFHILYGQPIPDGTNLHPDNLASIRAGGGRIGTFENDILVPVGASDYNRAAAISPYQEIHWGSWRAVWMDPTTEYIRRRQVRRAERLTQLYAPDAFYYDISTSFAPMGCLDPTHGHELLGYGRWMVHAYQEFHQLVREAAAKVRGAGLDGAPAPYLPMGTEGIHEGALMAIDFYQARAEAYPASFDFEGREFKPWISAGAAEKIPMFAYVYHEYGGIRLDGWGHLSDEEGDYAYAVAARTALWGGIYQLNYEFQVFDGAPSEEKLRFLREIAQARTTYGKPYLAYGRMLPAPEIEAGAIQLSWRVKNLPFGNAERSGRQRVPAVIASAWKDADGNVALFFVNVDTRPREVEWELDYERYGLKVDGDAARGLSIRTLIGGEPAEGLQAAVSQGDQTIRLNLPPRRVVMVEVRLEGSA